MTNQSTNIFLIGPMATGKTTIGKKLAKETSKKFYDSDQEIKKNTGADIPLIFEIEGDAGFRDREMKIISKLVLLRNIVLSTGGGIILSENNRELLSSRGTVFYLSTPIYIQVERTSKDKDRPLLKNGDPLKILTKLDKERKILYENVADHVVETENKSSQEVASEIVNLVKG